MAVDAALTETTRCSPAVHGPSSRAFAALLFTLAVALTINTVLGPVGTGAIDYPISGTLLNQVIGLEAVTVGLVVPMTIIAGVLPLRGHRAAAFGTLAALVYWPLLRIPSDSATTSGA